jgi:aspartate carbamoyltransferase catalytic subunit
MNPDVIILRHSSSGAPQLLAKHINASVINAGDGAHEHPSQGLLDMMTVMEHKGKIEGLKLAIIGDIAHSRVAVSDIIGFTRMGAEVCLAGPQTFMPAAISSLGANICGSVQEAVTDADVVMTLRIQLERQNDSLIPSLREYSRFYGVNRQLMELAKEDAIVMHPGPINRGVELSPDVADGRRSVILEQVTNGVAVRMALLYLVLGGSKGSEGQGESR